jgi:hypothetical protein
MKKLIELIKIICLITLTIFVINIALNINKKENNYDVNNDGIVNSKDLFLIKKYLIEEGDK